MASFDTYGTVVDADTYFNNRLHECAWFRSDPVDRPKALIAATRIVDTLNFKGRKATVYTLLTANPNATQDEIETAYLAQALEFPRGSDTDVPEIIKCATYEIAHSLLDGKDPENELEQLAISSQGYASVRTTYNRSQVPIEHLINYVPNPLAWRWLKPFLRDEDAIKVCRVS